MINKRGSHVGMVLSFVIFVTFLVFLYSALEPTINKNQDKQFLLEHLKISLLNEFEANLTTVTVSADKGAFDDRITNCLSLNKEEDEFANLKLPENFLVKDVSGTTVLSGLDAKNILIEWISADNNIFNIYFSGEKFRDSASPSCGKATSATIKLVKEEKFIFESKISSVRDNGYDNLKSKFNIPVGNNFWFGVMDGERINTLYELGKIDNSGLSVYSEEIPILYVDKEANINSGFLTIKVW